ncbi:MAG: transketolase [Panacagrimonas sp.]
MFKLPTASTPVSHRRAANALRVLAMDAVEAARSGHPGMPMGMADIAEVLWNHFLVHDPIDPKWPNRDRFVISNGHGSMLLYALLHLSGYDLSMDELRHFRKLHSRTPGHPEYGVTPGVETTTGPLGQGLANAVGMALAERLLASEFNRPGFEIVNHRTWVFVGDGCLMEGISHEAVSLAGTLGLDKLIVIYDDNRISIDGEVDGWFRDDTPARFEACGWRVLRNIDGHDPESLFRALLSAKGGGGKPVLICCKTVIGCGAPTRQGKAEAHGAPLGAEEVARVRQVLQWSEPPFVIPADVAEHWNAIRRGREAHHEWNQKMYGYGKSHPQLAQEFERRMTGTLPADWPALADRALAQQRAVLKSVATRKSSEGVLDVFAPETPELFGGSADLTESNNTKWRGAKRVWPRELSGRYMSYGVREFGMAAAMNGIALHGGLIPFGGTFAVFSDYSRNAIRMAALMRLRVIHVLTHDSIGLGEDGPTHQPVEHAASMRMIPHLDVWRPCDGVETALAWKSAIERSDGPSALLLSRQVLEPMKRSTDQEQQIARGAYVLSESVLPLAVVLIATGSEVGIAMQAQTLLAEAGIGARVVSMPCTQIFDRQDGNWRYGVLPPGVPRVAVEAGHVDFWRKYVGLEGAVIGMSEFGESAPAAALFDYFGINAAAVAEAARTRALRFARTEFADPQFELSIN